MNIFNTSTQHAVGADYFTKFDHTSVERDLHVMLSQFLSVPQELLDSVRQQVEHSLPVLKHGVSYTLKQICGKDYWKSLTKPQRIHAGQCMAYMVELGVLPFTFAGFTGGNHKQYQRK